MSHQLYGHVLCYDEFRSIIRTHIDHKIHVKFIGLQMRHTGHQKLDMLRLLPR